MLPFFVYAAGLRINSLRRSWISSENHLRSSRSVFLHRSFPACVIKFCLQAFVPQLPFPGLSKFILTLLLFLPFALSHRDLLLHLAFSYLSTRLSLRLSLSHYLPVFLIHNFVFQHVGYLTRKEESQFLDQILFYFYLNYHVINMFLFTITIKVSFIQLTFNLFDLNLIVCNFSFYFIFLLSKDNQELKLYN